MRSEEARAVVWRKFSGMALALSLLFSSGVADASEGRAGTNATYYNDAAQPGADPFVLYADGYYYAYSTEGADPGYHFGIYRSPDLITWERLPGGALPADDPNQWGRDWFWAPEVYHNPETGKYFLFYSARLREDLVAEHFRYPDFEEPCKIGVAVADSPAGPFHNISDRPIDYFPYDPDYHDVNLIMTDQKRPPATLEEGMTAPRGTYIPAIDPNVFFDDGRTYLYFSRNAYRNWVWDHDLGKYIEESNIYAVELTDDWWRDPTGTTMPAIHPDYYNANREAGDGPQVRKDGFTPILDYGSDKQAWENAHVNDYAESGGQKKDRRWEEGSTVVKSTRSDGSPVYFLTYSANNYENEFYGVGYAVADHPLGPWRKSPANPVLAQDEQQGMYSTGHGSVIASPDGSELYYVHHGRPEPTTNRRLYTERMHLDPDTRALRIDQSTKDETIPSGVAPYSLVTDVPWVQLEDGRGELGWSVRSRSGAAMDLANQLNRVAVSIDSAGGITAETTPGRAELHGDSGVAALVLRYQRRKSTGEYFDIVNAPGEPVQATVPVAACTEVITGGRSGPLRVTNGVLCLSGADVSGAVSVGPGASLLVVNSRISGELRVSGAESAWLLGSAVGSVQVDGVRGLLRIEHTRVAGAVSIRDSRTRNSPVVAGNAIFGSLHCSANRPAPVDDGRPNAVSGGTTGQCSRM